MRYDAGHRGGARLPERHYRQRKLKTEELKLITPSGSPEWSLVLAIARVLYLPISKTEKPG